MIHGYHVIFGTYGFWLPNDPRGSWSEFVASWELSRFGKATKSPDRIEIAANEWKVFLDTEEAIENAIRYVEENPMKEGKPRQRWSFVTPFSGVNRGGWMTYP